jgi:transposase InsO family protein
MLFKLFVATMAVNLKTLVSKLFCDLGLKHQFSSPYVACHNGVVERKNHSFHEMAWMMLDEHRTLRRYWAEAVNTACHVGNRIFLRVFMNKTCYKLMHGRAPRVSHFRAFCCRFLFSRRVGLISLSRGPSMGFTWVLLVILEHFTCSTLILT